MKIRAQENNFEKTQGSKAVNMIYFFKGFFNCTLSVIYKSETVVSSTESIRSERFTNIRVLFWCTCILGDFRSFHGSVPNKD